MVQIAVVSVSPYTCNTGMPSIMKNSCVSTLSGAEPQIRARSLPPIIFLLIVGNTSRFASPTQNPSPARDFPS